MIDNIHSKVKEAARILLEKISGDVPAMERNREVLDNIQRLREQLIKVTETQRQVVVEMDDLRKENEQLREEAIASLKEQSRLTLELKKHVDAMAKEEARKKKESVQPVVKKTPSEAQVDSLFPLAEEASSTRIFAEMQAEVDAKAPATATPTTAQEPPVVKKTMTVSKGPKPKAPYPKSKK